MKKFRNQDVGSLCRAGSLTAETREFTKRNTDLVAVQKVVSDQNGIAPDHTCLYGKGDLRWDFFVSVHKVIRPTVKTAVCVNDWMSGNDATSSENVCY
jgi:hypothetical protein